MDAIFEKSISKNGGVRGSPAWKCFIFQFHLSYYSDLWRLFCTKNDQITEVLLKFVKSSCCTAPKKAAPWMTSTTPNAGDFQKFPRKIAAFSAPKLRKIDAANANFRLQKILAQSWRQRTTRWRRAQFCNAILSDMQGLVEIDMRHAARGLNFFHLISQKLVKI